MSTTWDKVVARRRKFLLILLVVGGALAAVAIVIGIREHLDEKARAAIEGAKGIAEMEQVAEDYPHEAALLLKLGRAYARRDGAGDLKKAHDALRRALPLADNELQEGMITYDLGLVSMSLEQYEEALKYFDDIARRAGAGSLTGVLVGNEAHCHAGRCLELLQRTEEAKERYSRIKQESGDVWYQQARYRLTLLRREAPN